VSRFDAWVRRYPRATAVLCASAARSLLGWGIAFPIVAALGALGAGALPGGDRALFAPSGLLLVGALRLGQVPLLAAAETALLAWLCGALILALPTALVFAACAAPAPEPGAPFRRALALTPRFVALGALDYGLCALSFGLGLLAWPAVTSTSGDAHDVLAASVVGVALVISAAITVFVDLARLASLAPGTTLREAVDAAGAELRRRGFGLFCAYLTASGAGALAVALAARGTELCRVEAPGAWRVALVWLLHQSVLVVLTIIQAAWVRRLSEREGAIDLSPSAPRKS